MLLKPGTELIESGNSPNGRHMNTEFFLEQVDEKTGKIKTVTEVYTNRRIFKLAYNLALFFEKVAKNKQIELDVDFDYLMTISSKTSQNERFQLMNAYYSSLCSFDEPAHVLNIEYVYFDGMPFNDQFQCKIIVDIQTIVEKRLVVYYNLAKRTFTFTNRGFFPIEDRKKVRRLIKEDTDIRSFIEQTRRDLENNKDYRIRAILHGVQF